MGGVSSNPPPYYKLRFLVILPYRKIVYENTLTLYYLPHFYIVDYGESRYSASVTKRICTGYAYTIIVASLR